MLFRPFNWAGKKLLVRRLYHWLLILYWALSVLYTGMFFRLNELPEKLSGLQPKPAVARCNTL